MFRKKAIFGVMLVLVLVLAAVGFAFARSESASAGAVLTVEVAENGTMFTPDTEYMDEEGIPLYGGSFITEGYIYPEGTLNETNGVLEDGSPEFPDKVIGRWICRGWHVGQGGHTTDEPWTVTTQIWDFAPDSPFGDVTIVTDGYETPIVGEVVGRAITGGTGKYLYARGEQHQTLINFPNNSIGINMTSSFVMEQSYMPMVR